MGIEKKAMFAVFWAVLAVSFSAPLIKVALGEGTPPVIIAFYRLFMTTLLMLPITLGQRKYRREIRSLQRRDVKVIILSGVFLALHFLTWISSLKYTSTFGSTVLVSMQSIFVVAGSYLLFRERVSKTSLWGGVLAILGTLVMGMGHLEGGMAGSMMGDILALLGAFFVAGYILCGSELRQRVSLFPYTLVVYGVCSIMLFFFSLIMKAPLYPYSLKSFLVFFALSVLCTLMGHSVYNWALSYVKASLVAVSILGEPIGAALWAYLFFREKPEGPVVWGSVLILLGVILFSIHEGRKKGKDSFPSSSNLGESEEKSINTAQSKTVI